MISHLTNGTLGENLCIICLAQLGDNYENIFTKICKEDIEFCVANVLETISERKFSKHDNYNVCIDCYTAAFMAHKFYLLSCQSNEILQYYTNELTNNLNNINMPAVLLSNTLCISLPKLDTIKSSLDLSINGIGKSGIGRKPKIKTQRPVTKIKTEDDENIVIVIQENGEQLFYKMQADGSLILLDDIQKKNYKKTLSKTAVLPETATKRRRKRVPMAYKLCSRCPIKYRFAAKLKDHMKLEHNVDLFICKVCKAMYEDENEYHNHMRTHTNIHQCDVCHTVFKKRDTIINHLKWHEKMKNISQTEGAHICEICGVITEDEPSLREHCDTKHYKKFTCFYCGRLYKGEASFEMHIKKHEAHLQNVQKTNQESVVKEEKSGSPRKEANAKQKCMCPTCGRYFVDDRALMWHQRLHNNERPYQCDICGRGFVSLNRRNQHALCAHTAPTRRCPLCPALFHLRSMVNTHIRKVHLTTHKRRNRVSKHQNVYWRTEPVPIQDLSVDIQNDILELQAQNSQSANSSSIRDIIID